jgi:hypothetical protein
VVPCFQANPFCILIEQLYSVGFFEHTLRRKPIETMGFNYPSMEGFLQIFP